MFETFESERCFAIDRADQVSKVKERIEIDCVLFDRINFFFVSL